MPLSPGEAQIFEQLGSLSHDAHPDAHACRLKISIATRGTPHGDLAATKLWSLRTEYASYVAKWRFVSMECRLTVAEEALLLRATISMRTITRYRDRREVQDIQPLVSLLNRGFPF